MSAEIRELTETFFVDDESCVFTYDGSNLRWRDNTVSVSNLVAIDFVHSGNCCSEKRSKFLFRKLPHKCEGHDTMIVRYAESHKKNRLRLTSVKIRGEGQQLSHWLRVLRCSLDIEQRDRAKEFLVFVNPFSGRQNGVDVYAKRVKPIFDAAGKGTTVVVTKSKSDYEKVINGGIDGYDAILAVGGDGTVSEIVNSLISSRMETFPEGDAVVPKIAIPIGIIPCGSTDCVAYTLNGTRDAETSALYAILGNRTDFDVCRAISEAGVSRFFVSVFTYGYLSDLVKESEKFRWMGPVRYNYAGLLTLVRSKEYYGQVDMVGMQIGGKSLHREEASLDLVEKKVTPKRSRSLSLSLLPIVPTVEPGSDFMDPVTVCRERKPDEECHPEVSRRSQELIPLRMEISPEEEYRIRGRYFLIACANISCSSELTPNGLAPDCAPGDGNMNVVLFQPNTICDLYKMYARLTSRDPSYHLSELPFITIYRTKRVRIGVTQKNLRGDASANCDGELFHDSVVDIKIHERVMQFYARRQTL